MLTWGIHYVFAPCQLLGLARCQILRRASRERRGGSYKDCAAERSTGVESQGMVA